MDCTPRDCARPEKLDSDAEDWQAQEELGGWRGRLAAAAAASAAAAADRQAEGAHADADADVPVPGGEQVAAGHG